MPVDPEISLRNQPINPLGVAPPNPIGTLDTIAEAQSRMNANRMFQQQFAARQVAGQIIANSPDMDSAQRALQQNPVVGGYYPEIFATVRQLELLNAQLQGEYQTQAVNAIGAVSKAIPLAYDDPAKLGPMLDSVLKGMSPQARQRVLPFIETFKHSATDDLPSDPKQALDAYHNRIAGGLLSGLGNAEAYKALAGGTGILATKGGYMPYTQAPITEGGGLTFAPGAVPEGFPPTAATLPGGEPYVLPGSGIPPEALRQLSRTGNPLVMSPPVRQQAPGALGSSAPPRPQVPGAGATPPASGVAPASATAGEQQTWLGTPLFPKGWGEAMAKHRINPYTGDPQLSQPELSAAQDLQTEFSGKQLKDYNASVQAMGSLRYMDNAFDELARGGGFLTPGALGTERLAFAKTINMMATQIGIPPPFDPKLVGTAEGLTKETTRAGLMVVNQFLGGQREAAQIILGVTRSVPSIDNTVLGGKFITANLTALSARVQDQRHFMQGWADKNGGNLTGAQQAFDEQHPATEYVNKVLDQFGLTPKGFKSFNDLQSAVRMGYMTAEEGVSQGQLQHWIKK